MAFTVPTIEPTEAFAGDRWQWSRSLPDFPADEWTLTYYLRGNAPGAQYEIAATADDEDFSIDVATTTTAGYIPGVYYWSAFVSQSGDRKLIAQGRLEVKTNPADVVLPADGRSHARRTLEAIEAVIERRATTDQQQYVFQAVGRSVTRMPIADLLKFRDKYAAMVAAEDEKAAIDSGKASGRNVFFRFTR
jgi:hypothetical protein